MKRLNSIFLFVAAVAAVSCSAGARRYTAEIVAEYPHDTESYTQGLFFHNGDMYESTGLYGKSTFRKVDIESGDALRKIDFSDTYFIEGSTILKDSLYILTWENNRAFVYDADSLTFKTAWGYPREGWGLTTDGRRLIASDGSSKIFFMDGDFKLLDKVTVRLDGRQIKWLNELEWIDGKIWANVYTTDNIVIINPRNGNVEGIIDLTGLLPRELRTRNTDVLNGIAYNPSTKKIYVTGKNWPRLYEIKLKPIRKSGK